MEATKLQDRPGATPFRLPPASSAGTRGPDLLEELAERHANNGFSLEADILGRAAREWRAEREGSTPMPTPEREPAGSPFGTTLCEMVEADFRAGLIHVRPIGKYKVGAGKYWLMPVVQS